MDLSQKKLSKSEWASVEVPVDEHEKSVLQLILQGYRNPDICMNRNLSLYDYLKMPVSEEMDAHLFAKYFLPEIKTKAPTYSALCNVDASSKKAKPPNKADMIRMQKADQIIETQRHAIFEFVLLDAVFESVSPSVTVVNQTRALYSVLSYRKLHIERLNPHVVAFVDAIIVACEPDDPVKIQCLIWNARECIEKNANLMRYADQSLYTHQKRLFELFASKQGIRNRLVLYMAPTGTGKTLSPIGLSEGYRVIFVCVARHVGLALARSAISVNKRVAFAFGCETADDIRLHYFAAADYTVNKRSGGIYKVDNSNGSRVEIMICDVASYLVAMYYMKSFHNHQNIVTYWDEPTISMDYESHDLHATISRNWRENQIGKFVLSCATLPKADEIAPTLHDFKNKFTEYEEDTDSTIVPEIHTIDSYDCKKTIGIQNKMGDIVLPHLLFDSYRDIVRSIDHCDNNKTLLRYFDVDTIAQTIQCIESIQGALPEEYHIQSKFKKMTYVSLFSIKTHYLEVIRNITVDWAIIQKALEYTEQKITHSRSVDQSPSRPMNSFVQGQALRRTASVQVPNTALNKTNTGPPEKILITTRDAHTLTDGPTIFLAEDVNRIGQFYIQQSKIPETVLQKIQETIDKNNVYMKQLTLLEREVAEKTGQGADSKTNTSSNKKSGESRKAEKEPATKELRRLYDQIEQCREQIQVVRLPSIFVPNTLPHQSIWTNNGPVNNAFVPNVDDDDVRDIMALSIDNNKKILLILGIGVFSSDTNDADYMEVMKRLAYRQSLFLIIAASDYIYGTNYQFCHGFIGKDLNNMTQQKTIQAIGRIGRNALQQEYTVRFRDDAMLKQLFVKQPSNLEAEVMSRLFISS